MRATILGAAGDAKARREYGGGLSAARRHQGDDGAQNVLPRADLKSVRAECVERSKASEAGSPHGDSLISATPLQFIQKGRGRLSGAIANVLDDAAVNLFGSLRSYR